VDVRSWILPVAGALACAGDWEHAVPCDGLDATRCRVETLRVDDVDRTFMVVLPEGYACDPAAPTRWPLLLGWHGSDSVGADLWGALLAHGVDAAVDDAVVVLPDGLLGAGRPGVTGWDQDPDGGDVRLFDALLAHLVDTACVDPHRVFSVGHSRGARFVHTLACFRADTHVGFAGLGEGRPESWRCDDRAPVWMAHGVDDRVVPYREALVVREHWEAQNGCDPLPSDAFEPGACVAHPGCDVPVTFCAHEGAEWKGHGIPDLAADAIRAFFDGL
jgi:poly(3-hydroxybutyrate) depolymerase